MTYGPDFPYSASTKEPEPEAPPAVPTTVWPPSSVRLHVGDRVRSLVDDVCVTVGLEGLVVNVAPPRPRCPVRARVLWTNDTVSMADATTFEVLPKQVVA